MNEATLQIVIQSGAIGTNIIMLYVFLKVFTLSNQTQKDYNEQALRSQENIAQSNIKLAESLTKLADKVGDCPTRKKQYA